MYFEIITPDYLLNIYEKQGMHFETWNFTSKFFKADKEGIEVLNSTYPFVEYSLMPISKTFSDVGNFYRIVHSAIDIEIVQDYIYNSKVEKIIIGDE